MLKKISKLFLGLVVCASSACVTPTHASSAISTNLTLAASSLGVAPSIIMTKIQAASTASAKDELIEIYNTTPDAIDISGWCFVNKSSVKFACFEVKQEGGKTYHAVVPAAAHVTIVSNDFLSHNTQLSADAVALTFAPTSQSSGSLVASSDTLTFVNTDDEVVDSWSWQTAASGGKLLARKAVQADPLLYANTGTATDWQQVVQGGAVRSVIQWVEVTSSPPESDSDSDQDSGSGSGSESGQGQGSGSSESVENQPATIVPLQITELLPNAVGSDVGTEFIEVYNPNLFPVSGVDYKFLVGASLDKTYAFPNNFMVAPLSYAVIKNDIIKFSLSNTAGAVQLSLKGVRLGSPIAYANPPEGESWAIIYGEWQYTNNPTPGAANNASGQDDDLDGGAIKTVATAQKPCAINQYRSSTTGRCRLIVATTATSTQTPCKANQMRNPQTGRCRNNIAATAQTPCKTGQERSLETNRCRNITKMTKAGSGLRANEKTQPATGSAWYVWIGVGGVIAAVLGYAVWEWREELQRFIQKLKERFLRRG